MTETAPPSLAPFTVEELLRQSAPALPLALKKRTLNTCVSRTQARQRRHDRLHWQFTWIMAGLLALQSLTLFMVDAQNTRLVSGDSTPPPYAPVTIAEVTAMWHQRSRQLASLMESKK
ncbi:hypothetical protein EON80_32305, partial [bacterium]